MVQKSLKKAFLKLTPEAPFQRILSQKDCLLTIPQSSKYVVSRCLKPQTSPEKAFKGSKHLLTRYLEDFGCLTSNLRVFAVSFTEGMELANSGESGIPISGSPDLIPQIPRCQEQKTDLCAQLTLIRLMRYRATTEPVAYVIT